MDLEIVRSDAVKEIRQAVGWLCVVAMLAWAPRGAGAQEASSEAVGEAAASVSSTPAGWSWFVPVEVSARLAGSLSRFATDSNIEQKFLAFASAGVMARWEFAGAHGLLVGLSYVRKGSIAVSFENEEASVDYLHVPLLYRAAPSWLSPTPRVQLYAVLGPHVDLQVATGGTFGDGDGISAFDVGGTAGAGVSGRITPAWVVNVEATYSYGFTSIASSAERRNRTFLFGISLAYDFGGDHDRDGYRNHEETTACWDSKEDRDGFEDDDGCADPDNDQDRLADKDDLCSMDAEDRDGYQDTDGCPDPDNDEDGVADHPDQDDVCPGTPYWKPFDEPRKSYAKVGLDEPFWRDRKRGCPGEYKNFYVYSDSLYLDTPVDQFDERSAELKEAHKPVLDEVTKFLEHYPWVRLEVHGHSSKGEKRNPDQARAEAVRDYLIAKGISKERLVARARGDTEPFFQDCEPPRVVKDPAAKRKKLLARIERQKENIAKITLEDGKQSSRYRTADKQLESLERENKQLDPQFKEYERYNAQLKRCEALKVGEKDSARNRRVTFVRAR